MKNRFRLTIVLLVFALLISHGAMTVHAETEGAGEGGQVSQSESLSSDASLSFLRIAQAGLQPEFSSHQLTYTATVPHEVERVALTAQTNSPSATKVIRGTSDLKVGENIIVVTVTAEDGSVREYRITLIRQAAPEGESQTGGEGSQDETGEGESEEVTTLEGEEETEQEETMPPETKPSGGMIVETTTEASWDLGSMLTNPMMLIFLVFAIVIVLLFVIVAAIVVLREKLRGGDDEDDEDDEDENDDEYAKKQLKGSAVSKRADRSIRKAEAEVPAAEPEVEVPVQTTVQRVEIPLDELEIDWNILEQEVSQDDLDDDFELLLEDDDDFDFLDF